MRGVLAPLGELAARYGVAVIAVTHLNKASGGRAIYRASGSLALVAAARAAWSFSKDKADSAKRLMLIVKLNVGREGSGLS